MSERRRPDAPAAGLPAGALRWGVRAIDRMLSRRLRVFTYCDDPRCIMKAAWSRTSSTVELPGGAVLPAGARVLELHLWNERLAALRGTSSGVALAARLASRTRYSLARLARFLEKHDPATDVRAVHGELGFIAGPHVEGGTALLEHLGFVVVGRPSPSLRVWRGAFWQQLFSWGLMWTYAPAGMRTKRFSTMARVEVWMTRETLRREYLPTRDDPDRPATPSEP